MLNVKYFGFIVCAIFWIFVSPSWADDPSFVVEEELGPPPASIDLAIRTDQSFADYKDCTLVGKNIDLTGNNAKSGFVATTKDGCGWGNVKAPIWIVHVENQERSVVLNDSGYALQLLPRVHHGLHDVRITAASAGWSEAGNWHFDGSRYVKTSP